jgi:hypothetical protein
MLRIDNSLLQDIGLGGLPDAEKNSLLKHIYETLEMRVGIRLADQMSNEQLDEFERYFEAKDDEGAFKWLESNFPNYKDIVQEEFDKLKGEVAQSAPQILSASQTQPTDPQPQQSNTQPQYQQQDAPQQQPYNQPTNAPAPQQFDQPQPNGGFPDPSQNFSQPSQAPAPQPQITPPNQNQQVPSSDYGQPTDPQLQPNTQPPVDNSQFEQQQPPYPNQQPPAGPQPSGY